MKKLLFSIFFLSIMVVGANAQKAACSKTCTKSANSAACQAKAPSAASATSADYNDAAAKLASLDATIISRADATTGNVAYYRKETCANSGAVSYVGLSYDVATNTFVNVAPSTMEGAGVGTSGCAGKATSVSGKPGCSASAGTGKSCCAGKAASVKTAEKVKS